MLSPDKTTKKLGPSKVTNSFYDESMELSDSDDFNIIKEPIDSTNLRDSPPLNQLLYSEDGYDELMNVFLKNLIRNLLGKQRILSWM
jgi:hypothetical protein